MAFAYDVLAQDTGFKVVYEGLSPTNKREFTEIRIAGWAAGGAEPLRLVARNPAWMHGKAIPRLVDLPPGLAVISSTNSTRSRTDPGAESADTPTAIGTGGLLAYFGNK